ncbi:unnamed protein product [marine sediment metagenome]|uniref:Uncharacterized protein n=1 Tax=marine sediment metagenome TaxID=412755 RepID=X1TVS6_9ZZZZ
MIALLGVIEQSSLRMEFLDDGTGLNCMAHTPTHIDTNGHEQQSTRI